MMTSLLDETCITNTTASSAPRRTRLHLTASTLALALAVLSAPAAAQQTGGNGGDGINNHFGGSGGTTNPTDGTATAGGDGGTEKGGGGGGAGVTGGSGGAGGNQASSGGGGAGGAGGAAAVNGIGGNGSDGDAPTGGVGGGGGGGGGAHGAVVATFPTIGLIKGGDGGRGGDTVMGTGGGGGGGGYGVFVTGSGGASAQTITGGAGGTGGTVGRVEPSSGGSGGVGVFFAATGASLQNSGTITGGAGGASSIVAAGPGGAGVVGAGLTIVNSGTIAGGLSGDGATRANAITFTGGANTLSLVGSGSLIGDIGLGAGSTVAFAQSGDFTVANNITGAGGIVWNTNATLMLTGNNSFSYTGTTTVDGGTLSVNGSIASSSMTTVNASGTLGGIGIVGNTTINGGTLAPGNSIGTLTVNGSLTMTAASTYLVEVSATNADLTVITGTASLGGSVKVAPLARLAATTTYTIINAGTLTGTFDTASVTNAFARNPRLAYVGGDVLMTLDPGLLSPILPGNTNANQRSVATAIDNALLAGVNLPAGLDPLFGLSGSQLQQALTQISGETGTGVQQPSFDAANMFMGMMTDPFAAGRGDGAPGALPYADEAMAYAAQKRAPTDAFASMHRKAPVATLQERWNVWAAGFGGSQTTDGNAAAGSNNSKSSIYGAAVGADYWFSPFTVAGVSMAGGGTNFSVTGGGSGRSDLFQLGGFIRHNVGSLYVSAAAAYGWQDITTDRTVTLAGFSQLRAKFNANSYSGRFEVGNRFVASWIGGIGLTPYAAFQVTAFDLPSYAESVVAGSNTFALSYAAKTALSPRSELGLRSDKSFAVSDAILTLRGRAAWAHDTNRDRSAAATFQSLPGASFIVNGASLAKHTALTSASAELKWMNGWSIAGTFEGEFSDVTKSYAGKGVVRYAW